MYRMDQTFSSLLFLTWNNTDVIRRMMVIKAVDLAGIKPKLVATDSRMFGRIDMTIPKGNYARSIQPFASAEF